MKPFGEFGVRAESICLATSLTLGGHENLMNEFNHAYCHWLEEIAEAQQHCENVPLQILALRDSGTSVTTTLSGKYLRAHQEFRSIAERFPADQAPAASNGTTS